MTLCIYVNNRYVYFCPEVTYGLWMSKNEDDKHV